MDADGLVFGLLDTSARIGSAVLAEKLRDLTVSWSRYGYHGPIIEHRDIDHILGQAAEAGYRYCFVQGYGCILRERWLPDRAQEHDLGRALARSDAPWLASGAILSRADGWYGISDRFLLVDLDQFRRLGRPRFGEPREASHALPRAVCRRSNGAVTRLEPAPGELDARPRLPGWELVQTSLRHGLPIQAFGAELREALLDLAPPGTRDLQAFASYFGKGIERYAPGQPQPGLSAAQTRFLDGVAPQANNARRGVFLFNIEPYTDVELPPDCRRGPLARLYSVAAGFKPNFILHSHGMSEETSVVFFDYSPRALEVRKTIVEQWNGEDFPAFMRILFSTHPYPETFYQLWAELRPDQIDWRDVERLWQQELARFGGERIFREHWHRYRKLRHEYVACDILNAPEPLYATIERSEPSVMWFSNAPFTVFSNWHFPLQQRRRAYEAWVERLAALNPGMLLYGADYTNTSVNCISAEHYRDAYLAGRRSELEPRQLSPYQIRS